MPFREKNLNRHSLPHAQTKNAPPKERAAFNNKNLSEEIHEAQYVEHDACEGEKVPDHVGELESSR